MAYTRASRSAGPHDKAVRRAKVATGGKAGIRGRLQSGASARTFDFTVRRMAQAEAAPCRRRLR